MNKRPADLVIGHEGDWYLHRWYVLPQSRRWPNVMIHRYTRSDDDRAHHDHPWANVTFVLKGELIEHRGKQAGDEAAAALKQGDLVLRGAETAHRIELLLVSREGLAS